MTASSHTKMIVRSGIRVLAVAATFVVAPSSHAAPFVYEDATAGAIPDTACASSLTRVFNVSDTFTVSDLKIGINLSHLIRGQVRATLQSPAGTTVQFITNSGDASDNYDMYVSDDATGALNDTNNDSVAQAWFAREASPSNPLAAFDGQAANGNWTLSVCDVTGGTAGTLNVARLIFDGVPATPAPVAGEEPIQTYYFPFPEQHVLTSLDTITNILRCGYTFTAYQPADPIHAYASVSTSSDNTIIYYDHWEDGYEFDITNPTQSTTEIWGDGDITNGFPPGVPSDRLAAGSTVLLKEDGIVSTTRQAVIDYDAEDKIASTQFISVTRTLWATGSDTLFAGALEMYDVSRWGTKYIIPVGEDLSAASQEAFSYVGLLVQASDDATTVYIDTDGDGTPDQTIVLDEGETHFIDGGVASGTIVTSTVPVQVNLLTGDVCSTFESRWFTLFPEDRQSDSYYTAVDSYDVNNDGVIDVAAGDVPTEFWIHNPNSTPITVFVEDNTGTANVVIPAGGTVDVTANPDTGSHLYTTDGSKFIPIATIDSEDTTPVGGSLSNTNDWGFALTPEEESYQQILVGLGFGNDPTKPDFDENSSPVWLTADRTDGGVPTGGIDVCIDYGGDNKGPLWDPGIEWNYDVQINLDPFEQYLLTEDDGDQTGVYVFVCDSDLGDRQYAMITGAWGQDPATASGGSPAIDMGTTVPNLQNVHAEKKVELSNDNDGDGLPNVGDTLTYRIEVTQIGQFPVAVGNINFLDVLPVEVNYIPNTTEEVRITASGSSTTTSIPDAGVTPFPLDESGHNSSVVLPVGAKFILQFDVVIITLPPAPDVILNEAHVSSASYVSTPEVSVARFVAIGDTVWLDSDADGMQDFGEPGLAGVQLLLLDCDNDGTNCTPYDSDPTTPGVQTATTTTDANGNYIFDGLPSGSYSVVVTGGVPAGLGLTTVDDPGYPGDNSEAAVIGALSMYVDADFGFGPNPGTASVGDFVWNDANGDGVQDSGEAGLASVDVELYDVGPDGVYGTADDVGVVATTTTDASGNYLFAGVAPGQYVVQIDDTTLPAGSTVTSGPQSSSDPSNVFTLNSGDVDLTVDFGYEVPGTYSITNTVWMDPDMDGALDPGENGIAGVTVNLLDDNGNIVATTTTDANGDFTFSGLADGDYTIEITDTAGNLSGLAGTTSEASVWEMDVTVAGGDVVGEDFGYNRTGTIGDSIYSDANGNGVQDSGEPGIGNVTIELYDLGPDGVLGGGDDTLVGTTTTDGTGAYQFTGLSDGDYGVVVTDDNGELTGDSNTGDPNGGADSTSVVSLNLFDHDSDPGTPDVVSSDLDQDFGYQPPTPGSIDGTIWYDVDGDGIDDGAGAGETPLDGVTVNLVDPGPDGIFGTADDVVIATTTTDVNGEFSFTGLDLDETYYVDVVDGTVPSYAPTHTTDNDPSSVSDPAPQAITLTSANPSVGSGDTGGPAGGSRVDFGYGGASTTPITLGSFKAKVLDDSGNVKFKWSTVTEVGNLGFDLYQKISGKWVRINPEPIKSTVIDSVEVTRYSYDASGVTADTFAIVDVDIRGKQTIHGPFKANKRYGSDRAQRTRTDWLEVASKAKTKREARKARRKARLMRKAEAAMVTEPSVYAAASAGTASADSSLELEMINMVIRDAGVYRVTYEELAAAGLDLQGISVKRLAVATGGESVPIRVKPRLKNGKKKKFGPGGFIEFVAQPESTIYAAEQVYTLSVDRANARRIKVSGKAIPKGPAPRWYTETTRVAPQTDYSFSAPAGDPWFAARMLAWGGAYSNGFDVPVDNLVEGVGVASLSLDMWGVTDWPAPNDHHVVVSMNGAEVADEVFDGLADHPVDVELSPGMLTNGLNTINIELPLDTGNTFDLVNLESWAVSYPRAFVARGGSLTFDATGDKFKVAGSWASKGNVVYAVTNSGNVKMVRTKRAKSCEVESYCELVFAGLGKPARYFVASKENRKSPELVAPVSTDTLHDGEAEYLVVTHPDFLGEDLDRLVAARQADGYSVKVVDVHEIYAAYGGHRVDAQAIRKYLKHGAENMGTRFVLLVGGDTYDYHDHLGQNAMSFIPSIYVQTDQVVRFAPSDAAYADIDDDDIPDLAIGRLPVRSSDELRSVVDKTLSYTYNDYANSSVFAADAFDAGQQYSFKSDAETMIQNLPAAWANNVQKAYVDDLGTEDARDVIIDSINGQLGEGNGVALVSYVGHSGPSDWSFQGLFGENEARSLQNYGRPTVVTQWGCWNTYYVAPSEDTMGHAFMLGGDGGAAAVLGASTLTQAVSERKMALELYSRMLTPGVTLGQAVLEAKKAFAINNPHARDVILGWTLLGDPALMIESPQF